EGLLCSRSGPGGGQVETCGRRPVATARSCALAASRRKRAPPSGGAQWGQAGGSWPRGGCAAAGRRRWGANRTLPDSADDKYSTNGRRGRQIVCLTYTFAFG